MLLDKILTPRWKHKNPQVRKRALQALNPHKDESQKIYQEVIASDPELFIRRIAIKRLNNVSQLQKLRQSEQQSEIVEEATSRLCELLATTNKHRPLGFLKNTLSNISENRILEYVTLHANDAELQLLALDKVANESVLIELLNTTQFSKNKKPALDKLTSVNSLKRVIKILKRKDKELASHAQAKLDRYLQDSKQSTNLKKETKRTANEFIELINLCKFSGEWKKYQERCQQLHQRYLEMMVELKSQHIDTENLLSADVAQAFSLFEKQLAEIKENNSQQSAWTSHSPEQDEAAKPEEFEELSRILSLMEKPFIQETPSDVKFLVSEEEKCRTWLMEIEQSWNDVYSSLKDVELTADQSSELKEFKTQFIDKLNELQEQLKTLQQVTTYLTKIEVLNTQAENMLENDGDFDPGKAGKLLEKYELNSVSASQFVPVECAAKTQQLIAKLKSRKSEVETGYENLSDEFTLLIDKLDQALANGKAKTVKQLINRGRNILKQLPPQYVSRLDKKGLQKKFKKLGRDAESLLGWQQWSTSSAKEKLIEAMEKLALVTEENSENTDFDFSAIAAEINRARQQWKQASAGANTRDENLWEKFDAACNRAYQPCKDYFDKLGKERGRNLEARVNICQELEKYVDTVSAKPFEEINWKAIEKIIHVAHQDWDKLGVVNRSEREKINKRFRAAIHQLEKLLGKRKADNKIEKQQLITRVETALKQLQENSLELASAIDIVKKSQTQWKSIGAARKDKQLWDKFRSVCDAVFEIRKAEQKKVKQQEAALDGQREDILTRIQDCTELRGDDLLQARAKVDQLKTQWGSLSKLKKGHKQQRRFTEICQQFSDKIQQLREEQLREVKQLLQKNVAACYHLETLLQDYFQGLLDVSGLTQEVAKLDKQWIHTDGKSLNFSASIDQRFQNLKSIVARLMAGEEDSVKQQLADQKDSLINSKDDLCIQLEILAGKESPDASKQRRLELQVSQLAENMKQSSSPDIKAEMQSLISQWHTSGFMLAPESFDFERRFYSALESLDKDYQYPL